MNSNTTDYYPAARGLYLVQKRESGPAAAAAEALPQVKLSAAPFSIWALAVVVSLCLAAVALAAHAGIEKSRVDQAWRNSIEIGGSSSGTH